ncbi:hypothetical protein [Aureimonas pseudogalii]|uniref:Uncharacterized protein n=1 Tax=Aureimonas pseudogalii TaxID=1744844 RepID=A0A7W6H4U9_9HYPH|nr:hypothetical protein [Aureimonas pseudogalii]MBB3998389.1 hypothetical protein [Aureimonas pseudogalii]
MPSTHRRIVEAAGAAWHHASALQRNAGVAISSRERDALTDYRDEVRDTWLRAIERARREERRRNVSATLAALDYGADDELEFGFYADGDFDFSGVEWGHE